MAACCTITSNSTVVGPLKNNSWGQTSALFFETESHWPVTDRLADQWARDLSVSTSPCENYKPMLPCLAFLFLGYGDGTQVLGLQGRRLPESSPWHSSALSWLPFQSEAKDHVCDSFKKVNKMATQNEETDWQQPPPRSQVNPLSFTILAKFRLPSFCCWFELWRLQSCSDVIILKQVTTYCQPQTWRSVGKQPGSMATWWPHGRSV